MKLAPIIISVLLLFASVNSDRAREANRAYQDGDYERAEQLYRQVLEDNPDTPQVLFNLGNALAHQGEAEASREAFNRYRELVSDPADLAPAEYNIGYLYGEAGQTEEAIRHFRRALELDPGDEDTKFNFEVLKRRQQQTPPDEDDDDDQEEDQMDQAPQDAQPPPGADAEEQEQDDPQDAAGREEDTEAEEQPQDLELEITDEQLRHAEDIMNALEQIEKDLIQDFKKRQHEPVDPHVEDW